MRIRSVLALGFGCTVALAAAVGCSSSARYIYRPEENATATVAGRPAALYEVPPESPRGDVRIAALGIARLHARGDEQHEVRAMHVRMVVDDNDDAAWTVDTREQIGVLDGAGQSRPAFASASVGQAPVITIPPSGKVSIDLYYPLPQAMQGASEVPHFDVLWRVRTPERVVAERTSFERLRIEPRPSPDYGVAGAWWGPGWWGPGWYDPYWPSYGFAGAAVLPSFYPHQPAILAHPYPPPATRVR
jgi:hypothetical protein